MKEKSRNQTLISRQSSKIMIVDDEDILLNAIKKYLMAKEFNIITCNSGKQALEKIKEERIDLLVVDILMCDMNGYEFINHLRSDSQLGHIPFIFLTAKGMTEDRIKGYEIGCKAYLGKPFDPEELVAILDNILIDEKNIININNIKTEIKLLRNQINNFDLFETNLNFTTREISVLIAVSKGMSNKEIADNLNISVRNVEKYITRLLHKTSLSNRVKLANYRYLSYLKRANDGNRTRE